MIAGIARKVSVIQVQSENGFSKHPLKQSQIPPQHSFIFSQDFEQQSAQPLQQ